MLNRIRQFIAQYVFLLIISKVMGGNVSCAIKQNLSTNNLIINTLTVSGGTTLEISL